MRTIFCLIVLAALASCGGAAPRVTAFSIDPDTGKKTEVVYSEYLEFDTRIIDGKVRMHVLVTLGPERVPADWRFPAEPFVSDGRLTNRGRTNGLTEEVYEIYFTNLSSTPVTFAPLTLASPVWKGVAVLPSPISLEPQQYKKTAPLVRLASIYKPTGALPFAFRYSHAGREEQVSGTPRRLRVDELKRTRAVP
jgi:hypothetical protein